MKPLGSCLLALIAACLAGTAAAQTLPERPPIETAPTTRPALPPLSESGGDFRRSEVERFTEIFARDERRNRQCPPGANFIICAVQRTIGGVSALRGSAPWMAQITLPERSRIPRF